MSVLDETIDLGWNCTKNCGKKRSMPVEHHIIRFRKDYIDFFLRQENNVEFTITEGYQYLLRLIVRRLHACQLELLPFFFYPSGKNLSCNVDFSRNKRYIVADVTEKLSLKKSYRKNGSFLYQTYAGRIARYTVIEPVRKDIYYLCPFCGQKNIQDSGHTRCSSCGKIFYPSDLDQKVVAFGFNQKKKINLKQFSEYINRKKRFFVYLSAAVGFVGSFILYLPEEGLVAACVYCLLAFFIFGGLAMLLAPVLERLLCTVFRTRQQIRRSVLKNHYLLCPEEFEEEVLKKEPFFSVNLFLGCLENVLQIIHFSESPKEYEMFTFGTVDISDNYQNVIECSLKKTWFYSYSLEGENVVIQVKAQMELLIYEKEKIKKIKETAKVRMVRHRRAEGSLGEIYLSGFCPHCGTRIQPENGSLCVICGKQPPDTSRGWLLAEYQVL